MKHLIMGVYQVCSNKSPWVKIGPAKRGGYQFLTEVNATNTGKLLERLPRNDVVAELNAAYCRDLEVKLLTPPPPPLIIIFKRSLFICSRKICYDKI
jgi:hypothetical protein